MLLNEEEKLVNKIKEKTNNGTIHWNVANSNSYANLIDNPQNIKRIFESDPLNQVQNQAQNIRKFIIYEIKKAKFNPDWEDYYEVSSVVLALINNNTIERSYTSETVSGEILLDLLEKVSNKVFDTDSFMNSLFV